MQPPTASMQARGEDGATSGTGGGEWIKLTSRHVTVRNSVSSVEQAKRASTVCPGACRAASEGSGWKGPSVKMAFSELRERGG